MKVTMVIQHFLAIIHNKVIQKDFNRNFQLDSTFIIGLCCIVLFTCFCQKKVQKEVFIVTATNDTLTATTVRRLIPGELSDSVRFCNALVRKGLSLASAEAVPDSINILLAQQLSLESGVDWSLEAAELLSDAARTFRMKFEEVQNCSVAVVFAESLFNTLVLRNDYQFPKVNCSEQGDNKLRFMSELFSELFQLNRQTSTALVVFTNDQTEKNTGAIAEDMVKGLVSEKNKVQDEQTKTQPVKQTTIIPQDGNLEELLRLRDQNSITASISKHIPEIKSLYKKHLKQNSVLGGTIFVTFRVAPEGDVLEVSVAKTDIDDSGFIQPLLVYLKTIQFKPVAKKAGIMTFEFPFQFDKEL